ncbi:putative TonB-dependent receptor [Flavihumibacter petaseus NBRC 106054]|uniref:Putative TonB-dependent receptor n=2 Tax=Flavihumibacter TaxID=1004301 RepID=A0A0E9MUR9_9BACT|nr:putative TonB-dependent receptor [Flavihumibacter petaseus NBRC 106054]
MLLLLLLSVTSAYVFAQQKKTVTGTVRDDKGNPLSGVTFVIKGTRTGGVTDNSGNYLITLDKDATLVFSGVGFKSQEISTSGRSELPIVMASNAKDLDEVVVTGFGTRKQTRKLASSVTEIKGDEIVRANNANVLNALQGKVAGVSIQQGASGPQSSSRIRIRGNTSITGNNNTPLIVMDGILIEPGTTGNDSWGENPDFGNIMKNLNSDDFESVSVLKGASASALYGSKAQNGVLLITTKKGRARKGLGLNVSHSEMYDNAYKFLDLQNEYGGGIYPTFEKDANGVEIVDPISNINVGGYSFGPKFDGRTVKELDGRMIKWEANDPLDYFQTGKFINTNVAVEGGNERTTFRFSYSNLYTNSIMPNNDMKRNSFTFRATHKISNAVNIDASVNYVNTKSYNPIRQGSRNNPLFAFTYYMPRHVDIMYYNSHYTNPAGGALSSVDPDINDPYRLGSLFFTLNEDNREKTETNLLANVDLSVKLNSWLDVLVRANTNYYADNYERKFLGNGVGFTGGNYQLTSSDYQTFRIQALLNGNKQLTDDFSTTFSLGGETYQNVGGFYNNAQTDGGLKIPGQFSISNSVNPATTDAYPTKTAKRTDALYLYGDVSWRNMLTLSVSGRNDWSSTLTYADGHGNYTYFYPSVGLAWIFTELPAVKNFQALSYGKLRGALSWTGLDADPQVTNNTGYYGLVGTFNSTTGNQSVYGWNGSTLGNQDLKNQLTREIEIGADLRFFSNRLGIDFAWYKKNTYNQIFELNTPSESGITKRLVNGGNVENTGIEILLTTVPVRTKDLTWNANFTFTRNRNKIIEIAPGVPSIDLELAFGADVVAKAVAGGGWGDVETGFGYAYYQKKDADGKPIDHPSNGQKVIGTSSSGTGGYYTYMRSQDYDQSKRILGNILEDFLAGTTQTVNYKNFFLNVQIDAKIGGLMASATHQYGSANGSFANSLFGRDEASGGVTYTDANGVVRHDGIIPEGVMKDGITATNSAGQTVDLGGMTYKEAYDQGLLKAIPAYHYYENLSQWSSGIREYSIFENSWVALREVSIGYSFPARMINKIKCNNLRVSLVGRNLTYLYRTTEGGVNPESIYSNRSAAFAEYGGYPFVRSLGFNVNAAF